MTKKQENVVTSFTTTNAVLTTYNKVWIVLPAAEIAVKEFRNHLNSLLPEVGNQVSVTTGIAKDKEAMRNNLAAQAKQLADNLVAYAMSSKNKTLQEEMHFANTAFDRMRDNLFPIVCQNVLEKSQKHYGELSNYGTSANMLKDFEQALQDFTAQNTAPRIAIGNRKKSTADVATAIKDAEFQLSIMDKLVGNFSSTDAHFVAAYRSARMVINLGARKEKKEDTPPKP